MRVLKIDEFCYVPLSDLGVWLGGGTPSKAIPAYWKNGTIPWVSPKDMKIDHIKSAEDSITEKAVIESATNLIPSGSILVVTRSGILRHTFPIAVTDIPVTINQDLKALVPKAEIDPKYVAFALRSFGREILNQCSKQGTTVNSIETKALLRFQIPFFSFPEQTRIVAEIEKQFSRLDEAVANLKRVKANLKRYKVTVLKAAVEGKLTEEWRKQHPDVEPADKLLERILAERRKGVGKGKYKEPVGPDTSGLPELPAGWVWASAEQLAGHIVDGTHHTPTYVDQGIDFISAKDVDSWKIDFSRCRKIPEKEHAELIKRCHPKPGHVLVTKSGTIGRVAIVKIDKPFSLFESVAVIPLLKPVSPEFVGYAVFSTIQGEFGRKWQKGVAVKHLHLEDLRRLPIPFPPLKEQEKVVEEFERLNTVAENIEKTIEAELRRADRLRQSILKQAFSGQLVPQDPNDEPASVLLERIRKGVGAIHESPARATSKPKRAIHESPLRKPRSHAEPELAVGGKFVCLDDVTAAILGLMQPGREYARADLTDALDLSTGRWNAAIQELKRTGKVQQTGEKRGARYQRME